MKFVIRTSAREDILRQYQYYLDEVNEKAVAERYLKAIQSAIAQVCRHPGIGVPKSLTTSKLAGLRSWPVKGFSEIHVYYLLSEEMLRVVRVLHGRRDIDPLLEDETENE